MIAWTYLRDHAVGMRVVVRELGHSVTQIVISVKDY